MSTELERALPALREAEEALNVLTKKDISELKVGGAQDREPGLSPWPQACWGMPSLGLQRLV